MRSLFLKIFLWFWLAMVLVSVALFLSSALRESRNNFQHDEEMDRTMTPLVAARLADIYDAQGKDAFATYLRNSGHSFPWQPYLIDSQGHEVLGRNMAAPGWEAYRLALGSKETQVVHDGRVRWVGLAETTHTGNEYVLVLHIEPHEPPAFWGGPWQIFLARILVIVLIVGLISLALTRHITSPIVGLRKAANQLASGNLSARVEKKSGKRKDELAELSHDFDHMAERIETLLASQQRLLSDISHELRSPLARLSVALGIARRSATPESALALNRIERETQRLNELIGGLLDLARLESGNKTFTRESIDLKRLVEEIVSDADFEAGGRDRKVRLISAEASRVLGNADLLRSAIENVVRNAVNYTPEGTEVEVELVTNGENGCALIRVRDHGPGVPETSLQAIFEPFYRVEASRE